MRRNLIVTIITAVVLLLFSGAHRLVELRSKDPDHVVKVGYIYDGDESAPYTANYMRAQRSIEEKYGGRVQSVVRNNTAYGSEKELMEELADAGCELIFTTSYGYQDAAKEMAAEHPEIQICQSTGDTANTDPLYSNYHNFMGRIYEGRYAAGIVAGMKLREMIDTGVIRARDAKVGYVAAYPYAEVISGYTAFLLGIRSVVPEAVMVVRYTDTWSSYALEYECARTLIDEGCVIISQHSDTIGPAVACEEANEMHPVYHVGYNQSMIDVAPTSSLVSTRINWQPYMEAAVEAVIDRKKIEEVVRARINGNDACAGFERGWVEMMEINEQIAAEGTVRAVDETIDAFKRGSLHVFSGDYTGTDPFDKNDTIDLSTPYQENETASAPSFHYVLDDVIIVEE